MACADSEDSDQPGHLPSLIRFFAVRIKKDWVLSYPLSAQQRLWSDWADAQADLSLRWAHMPFCCFCDEAAHMRRPRFACWWPSVFPRRSWLVRRKCDEHFHLFKRLRITVTEWQNHGRTRQIQYSPNFLKRGYNKTLNRIWLSIKSNESKASRGIILSRQRTTKTLIRLRGCAGWSAPLLFAYGINRFSDDMAQIIFRAVCKWF